jgi:opine dehydrogenase
MDRRIAVCRKEQITQDTVHDELLIAILGTGHGGRAMAANLAVRGYHVNLYNRTPEHIEGIQARGGIELQLERDLPVLGRLTCKTGRWSS